MYHEEFHPKYFNALMVKQVYDYKRDNCIKVFKDKNLDEEPNAIFTDCLLAIAPKSKVYYDYDWYDSFNCSYGTDMILFRAEVIEKFYSLHTRINNYISITICPDESVKRLKKHLDDCLRLAHEWLQYIDRYTSGCFDWNYKSNRKGIKHSLTGSLSVGADTEILHALIQYLCRLDLGLAEANEILDTMKFKEDVY